MEGFYGTLSHRSTIVFPATHEAIEVQHLEGACFGWLVNGHSIKQRTGLAVDVRLNDARLLGQFRRGYRADTHVLQFGSALQDLPTCDTVSLNVVPSLSEVAS